MNNSSSVQDTTLRYWKASLAWKNVGDWAKGWTQGSFIEELQQLCCSHGKVGELADTLLDDMIHAKERTSLMGGGEVLHLIFASQNTAYQDKEIGYA